jgi:hypothetical protein
MYALKLSYIDVISLRRFLKRKRVFANWCKSSCLAGSCFSSVIQTDIVIQHAAPARPLSTQQARGSRADFNLYASGNTRSLLELSRKRARASERREPAPTFNKTLPGSAAPLLYHIPALILQAGCFPSHSSLFLLFFDFTLTVRLTAASTALWNIVYSSTAPHCRLLSRSGRAENPSCILQWHPMSG